ncbi:MULTISPECIES: lipopolysaccharide assembly LapA domain-containing protein [Arthrobacter]|uniref:DUF1049 domain-containing protein n=1 Tax=Arthrobacter oryzae TaxID=409290 RepID=A0A3N0BUU2_9MICC|nr:MULTISPECIES: lipopolysaccharide assembly protein LapA domain-containing protein [Arthrobacter]QYF88806.1 lipopolysaccharide assembly protein LapA domain-containing protein [Arthrobacter sp. PAMC25284]RNL53068.1 DUF1049 domain-containing protein [Arthrobacter oryzae]
MTQEPTNHGPRTEPDAQPAAPDEAGSSRAPTVDPAERSKATRAGMVWTAVVAALAVLVFLIVFFLQNQDTVRVQFLGLNGLVPLGLALVIAAVAGGILVAIAGAVRIIQLRAAAHRQRMHGTRTR